MPIVLPFVYLHDVRKLVFVMYIADTLLTWYQTNTQSIEVHIFVMHAHGEVYSIQLYVIKFVRDLWQVGGFLHYQKWSPRYNWNSVEIGVSCKSNYHIYYHHDAPILMDGGLYRIFVGGLLLYYLLQCLTLLLYAHRTHENPGPVM
jgi:hypothetical protein